MMALRRQQRWDWTVAIQLNKHIVHVYITLFLLGLIGVPHSPRLELF